VVLLVVVLGGFGRTEGLLKLELAAGGLILVVKDEIAFEAKELGGLRGRVDTTTGLIEGLLLCSIWTEFAALMGVSPEAKGFETGDKERVVAVAVIGRGVGVVIGGGDDGFVKDEDVCWMVGVVVGGVVVVVVDTITGDLVGVEAVAADVIVAKVDFKCAFSFFNSSTSLVLSLS
jgi:hypothetical protein